LVSPSPVRPKHAKAVTLSGLLVLDRWMTLECSKTTRATGSQQHTGRLRLLRRSQVDAAGLRRRQRCSSCRRSLAQYRQHRPHRYECSDLQDFLAGGTLSCYRPQTLGYRPFLQLPPAYRPRRKCSSWWYFVSCSISAVDAGDRFTHTYLYCTKRATC
jgi:hypothetical protein